MINPFESTTFGNSLSLRVDGAIGAMSLSPNGRDAVLAGRKGLFIIDLDDPFTTPRWIQHITSWEVADVQWSPHHQKPLWCISTSNQKALLWDLARPSNNAIQNVLHRHTRAITDINFHPSDPELLATCSIDTFLFVWDMRTPRRPINKYAEWRAGATQVKWNHSNPYQLASSHHHSFYVWDLRQGALPLLKIENAHNGKINGLDFSSESNRIISCSNDKTVKLWDTTKESSESKPTIVISADYPVARARALPFGTDKCCGIMPVRGGEDAIHIVNYNCEYDRARSFGETVYMDAISDISFKGHEGPLKDFLWRKRHEVYDGIDTKRPWKEYQLVTWSPLDFDLKLWPHQKKLYDVANYNPLHHRIFDLMVANNDLNSQHSILGSPELDTPEDLPQNTHEVMKYNSYVSEPELSLVDIAKDVSGDLLSRLTLFKIRKSQENQGKSSQSNHLSWISGVRIGSHNRKGSDTLEGADDEGPSNLGEEVSIVGHKFPKVRFEKISVSTGHLVMSLRGVMPTLIEPEKIKHGSFSEATSTSLAEEDTVPSPIQAEAIHLNNVSMSADLNPESKLVFIRLNVKFPKLYPFLDPIDTLSRKNRKDGKLKKLNNIKFEIEETHELNSAVKKDMIHNLDQIAHFFTNKYNKFCLEPCLRYLMGDRINLEDSMMLEKEEESSPDEHDGGIEIGNESWVDDLIYQHEAAAAFVEAKGGDEDEDDDDSDLIPGTNDQHVSSTDISVRNIDRDEDSSAAGRIKHDSTPLPKGCGAIWTHTGQLVCFFIPKSTDLDLEQKQSQKFNILKFTENGFELKSSENSAEKVYTNNRNMASSADECDSEDNDSVSSIQSYSSFSSDDSFSNDWDEMLQDDMPSRGLLSGAFRGTVAIGKQIGLNKNSSIRRTASGKYSTLKSSTVEEFTLRSTKKTKHQSKAGRSVITILDFTHLIPDKYELACNYRVLGDSPENIARHNSDVARRFGFEEIAQVWSILEMILVKRVKFSDLTEIGRDIFPQESEQIGQFFWGNHPLGYSWFIRQLFAYFEKKQNVQMLAMLSCILFENIANIRAKTNFSLDVPIHTPYSSLPQRPSIVSMREHGFISSSEDITGLEMSPQPESVEGKTISRKPSVMSVRDAQLTHSMSLERSNSPSRFFKHNGSAIMNSSSVFESCEKSSSYGDQDRSKNFDSQKNFLIGSMRRGSKGVQSRNSKFSQTLMNRGRYRSPPAYFVEMKNEDDLDLYENVYTSPLLSGIDAQKIVDYRLQYADMLFCWGLPFHRIKFLKFNHPNVDKTRESTEFEIHKCHFGYRRRKGISAAQPVLAPVTPIQTAKKNRWNTLLNQVQKCGFCGLIVSKRVVVCNKCEHLLHFHCAAEWVSPDDSGQNSDECPTGCGCICFSDPG